MKKRVLAVVVFFSMFFASLVVLADDYVYVVNSYGHSPVVTWSTVSKVSTEGVSLIDTLTLPACNNAHSAALTKDRSRLWVTCPASNIVEIIDTNIFEIVDTLDFTGVFNLRPMGITRSPDGDKMYITFDGFGGVTVRNADDGTNIYSTYWGDGSSFITLNPDGSMAYITGADSSVTRAFRTSGKFIHTVAKTLNFSGHALMDAVVSPNGKYVYISNMESQQIEVIRTSDNTALAPIPTEYIKPRGIAISPDSQYLFVGHFTAVDALVTMLRLSDNTIVAEADIPSNPRRIVINEEGTRIYVTEHNTDEVYAYNVSGETLTYAGSEDLNAIPGYLASPVGIVLDEGPFPWHLIRPALDSPPVKK